jgi:ribosomal protein S18 acetylase RimI-like enzyme
LEFREIHLCEVLEVAKLYNELAIYIRDETKDEYFVFDSLSDENLSEELKAAVQDDSKKIFVAKEDDKIIGFIAGEILNCFLPISKVKKTGYISGAYVMPQYRGKNVMKRLEQMLIRYFKSKNL